MPIAALYKRTHQKQQCGLWLMEISYECLDNLVGITWGYDNLSA